MRWIFFLIIFFFSLCITGQRTFSQDTPARNFTSGFAARQQSCLNEILSLEQISAFDRAVALYLCETRFHEANEAVLEIEPSDLNLQRSTILMRILFEYGGEERQVSAGAKEHIITLLKQYFETSQKMLLSPDPDTPLPEVQKLSAPAGLLLWTRFVRDFELAFAWDGRRSNEESEKRFETLILKQVDEWIQYGFLERGSPYYTFLLANMLNLHDYANNNVIRQKCAILADILIADIALESIGGLWAGVRLSVFEAVRPVSGSRFQYVLFGSDVIVDDDEEIDPYLLILCNTRYRPPQVLEQLGSERVIRGKYELKHSIRQNITPVEESNTGRKYSYITPQFVLSSFQLRASAVPMQTRPWDLMIWDGKHVSNRLFTFTGDQLFSGGEPPYDDSYYLWNATSLQYKNVLFCQFHPSDKLLMQEDKSGALVKYYELQPTRLWIPSTLALQEEEGWWFGELSGVYIALRPLPGKGYWWRNAETDEEDETASILTFQELHAGFLIEVELANHTISSFSQFKKQVIEAPLNVDENSVTFVSRRGDVILFPRKNGDFLVNGRKIDEMTDPEYDLFSTPFTKSKFGSGVFQAQWNTFTLKDDIRDATAPLRLINTQ